MSNEEENIEGQEQEKQPESAVETLGDVVETQGAKVAGDVSGIKEAGEEDNSRIEENKGLLEEVGEMKKVVEETTEEAEEAKEEYYEELRSNIPNFDDKVDAIKKEEGAKEAIAEAEELPAKNKAETENPENEKTCQNCGAIFQGTANFCVKCGTKFEKTETEIAEPKVEKRKDGQLFDRLSELNVSIEAINMKDQEAAIKKINSALSDLDSFIIDNHEAIDNNQELETIVNAVRNLLEEGKSMIEKSRDDTQNNKEDIKQPSLDVATAEFMKDRLNKLEEKGLGDEIEANYIKRKLKQEQEGGNSLEKDEKSEKPSISEEAKNESPVEYYQDIYNDTKNEIATIINSDKNSYEKIDDLDRVKKVLMESNDNFIPDDILEDEGVKEMIKDLKNEFNIARAKIEESKTEEEKKSDAKEAVDFAVNNAEKSLDILKKSEETPSGKISSLTFNINSLNNIFERYKDIINSNGELKTKLNSARELINSALKEQEELQAENDKLAAKYNM